MPVYWYYLHDKVTMGPFTAAEIKERAARNMILESDPIWQAGGQAKDAPAAKTAREAAPSKAPPAQLPDWLDDVAKVERKGPLPGPVPGNHAPQWLDDLRLWYGLEMYAVPKSPQQLPKPVTQVAMPDWLDEAPAAPPQPQAAKTMDAEVFLAEKAIRETGFDPRTGQIRDPQKFHAWQQATSATQPALTNESLLEVFRQARIGLESWVAEAANRPLVQAGDLDAIKSDARVAAILRPCEGLAHVMYEKLLHHLDLIVEGRRRHYASLASET